jgi:hypothetical protein
VKGDDEKRGTVFEAQQQNKALNTLDIIARVVSHAKLNAIIRPFANVRFY